MNQKVRIFFLFFGVWGEDRCRMTANIYNIVFIACPLYITSFSFLFLKVCFHIPSNIKLSNISADCNKFTEFHNLKKQEITFI